MLWRLPEQPCTHSKEVFDVGKGRQRESRSSTYLLDMVCKGVLVAAMCCQRILQAVLRGSRSVRAQLHSWAEGSNGGAATGMLLLETLGFGRLARVSNAIRSFSDAIYASCRVSSLSDSYSCGHLLRLKAFLSVRGCEVTLIVSELGWSDTRDGFDGRKRAMLGMREGPEDQRNWLDSS